MFILAVGVNHRTAPVEVRERLSFSESRLSDWLTRLKNYSDINGAVIISTCNRTEIFASTADITFGSDALLDFFALKSGFEKQEIEKYIYIHKDPDKVVQHLFRVVTGIDSMVLGETQILGQVLRAYQISCENGFTNKLLNALFHKGISVGKKVRTETGIDKNPVSISYAAVELVRQIYGSLEGLLVLVIGAGKMSELTVKYLMSNGISGVIVSNRSYDKALEMAGKFGGRAVRFSELDEYLTKADIIISCTSASHYVIRYNDILKAMRYNIKKRLLMIDIAVPRDIEPSAGSIEGVKLYDVDDLQNVIDNNLQEREKAAKEGMEIIDQEVSVFIDWMSNRMVVPTISSLMNLGESIKEKELIRALNRLGEISDYQYKVISSMANSIVKQLLHNPITRLKEYNLSEDGEYYQRVLQNLFDLDLEDSCQELPEDNISGEGKNERI
ncbi:MAG: glutamyl-tRNA reductase [Peptococcaceae bacterium]|nr:glutamyl-tRNA reductase [Peptococcaceae bacterium]